jgi:hypothetical protein
LAGLDSGALVGLADLAGFAGLDFFVSAGLTALPLGAGFLTGFFDGTSVVPWGGWIGVEPGPALGEVRRARNYQRPSDESQTVVHKPHAGPKKQNPRRKRGRRG